jgi:TadE-like protein
MKPTPDAIGARLRDGSQRGAVLVEFALVLPLLALLFLTVVDMGLVVHESQVLQNAAREGARFSALPISWIYRLNPVATEAAIKERVTAYCREEGIVVNPADVTIGQRYPIDVGGGVTALGSEVVVSYERAFLIPGAPLLPFNRVRLTSRAVFRNLY